MPYADRQVELPLAQPARRRGRARRPRRWRRSRAAGPRCWSTSSACGSASVSAPTEAPATNRYASERTLTPRSNSSGSPRSGAFESGQVVLHCGLRDAPEPRGTGLRAADRVRRQLRSCTRSQVLSATSRALWGGGLAAEHVHQAVARTASSCSAGIPREACAAAARRWLRATYVVASTRRLRSIIWSTDVDTVQSRRGPPPPPSGVPRRERFRGQRARPCSSTANEVPRVAPPGRGRPARPERDGVRGRRRVTGRSPSSHRRRSSPFAGHPAVGTAWLLARERTPVRALHPPAGRCPGALQRTSDALTSRGSRGNGDRHYEFLGRLGSAAEGGGTRRTDGRRRQVVAWAFIDEDAGVVRVRVFPWRSGSRRTGHGRGRRPARERSSTGELDIRQGRGSRIGARPLGDGRVEIGGRSVLDHVREHLGVV